MISLQKLIVLALFSLVVIEAHTWIQCTDYKADGTCAGFIRNFHGRNTPGDESTDDFYTNKLLGQDPNFLVCKSDTQATATYSTQYPRATARAGTTLKTMYTPNGHSDPGDVGENTFARIHWNRGPNGPATALRFRKDLNTSNELSRTNYAINCQRTGDFASLPCVNSYTIPRDTPPGVYSFVWYWPYNKVATQRPFGEEYYSCFEINVLAADGAPTPSSAATPTSAPRTSASSSAPRTSASSSAPRTSASSSAPRTSASSSAARTSASSSAPRVSSSRLQETTQQDETKQDTTETSKAASSVASNVNSTITDLDVASHSNQFIAIGLLTFAFLI